MQKIPYQTGHYTTTKTMKQNKIQEQYFAKTDACMNRRREKGIHICSLTRAIHLETARSNHKSKFIYKTSHISPSLKRNFHKKFMGKLRFLFILCWINVMSAQ